VKRTVGKDTRLAEKRAVGELAQVLDRVGKRRGGAVRAEFARRVLRTDRDGR